MGLTVLEASAPPPHECSNPPPFGVEPVLVRARRPGRSCAPPSSSAGFAPTTSPPQRRLRVCPPAPPAGPRGKRRRGRWGGLRHPQSIADLFHLHGQLQLSGCSKSALFSARLVYLPGAPNATETDCDPTLTPAWVRALVDECAAFPNAAHDDQVDALSQALTRLAGSGSGYRQKGGTGTESGRLRRALL